MFGFMRHHRKPSLRSPEATSIARAQDFDRDAVARSLTSGSNKLWISNMGQIPSTI